MKRKLAIIDRKALIEKIVSTLKDKEYTLFAYIFGSFTTGDDFNDIDIGIFIAEEKVDSPLSMELELERELEDVLHVPVDVRILNNAPLSFVYNVLKNGVVIVDVDALLRADFEGMVYKKYFDFRHLRNEYLREILHAAV